MQYDNTLKFRVYIDFLLVHVYWGFCLVTRFLLLDLYFMNSEQDFGLGCTENA